MVAVVSTLPRCLDPWDSCVSYLLPDCCATNIPRRGPGGCDAHTHARGLLVELVRRLGAAAVSLHYFERPFPAWGYHYNRTVVTAVVDAPRFGRVRVVPRQVVGRISGSGKLGISGSARPTWMSCGRFQDSASCGRTVL